MFEKSRLGRRDGSIYFTDPWSSPSPRAQWDLTFSGLYRVTPDLGTVTLLLDDMLFPNGLAFTPDESVIYVDDLLRGHIRAFDVAANGTLARQTDRVFADLRGSEPGVPDGMKVDTAGNVYCGGAGGIWIIDTRVRNWAASSTARTRPPISALAATTGRRCSSRRAIPWAR
jgi:gluconolactonase